MTGAIRPFPVEWRITKSRQIADTVVGTVFDVCLDDGAVAVVKQFKEKALAESLRGLDFLEWRDGLGAIRVLDRTADSALLEHGGAFTLRDELASNGDEAATRIAAETLSRYHRRSAIAPPGSLQPLEQYFSSLFGKARKDRETGTDSLFVEAASMTMELLASQQDVKPLHGDLHHENIMHGDRGWLVIDPAGLIGEPALDVANMFSNPLDRFDLTRNEERLASMATIFADTLKRDERTILRYAFAYGCLSAAWHEEDGNLVERDNELAVVLALRNVLSQS